ncbi:PKD domain-containing protein [Pseudobacteroides cellulosolvens]|uniref:Cytochrome c domain-containing protein n=1 Tax=Pseudobacteroides cellulosolvens ATCC 35603 = DSM 2933 TaxID=398512 RepID=A0A0L6JJU3_9FIRM|nr:dockerin type I domain-containing protein [Pseudobacteroides cellulosolvens]KNY26015.1 hypothetical protein Bccel_1277 [Pseudobacteroides cellulosolvens ATCC 35603 = DSM 2933]
MARRVLKSIIFICILSLLVFSSIQIFSEGVVTPIKGGKVAVDYMEPDAYSEKRLAEGKAMFEAKCAVCHTDSGRDMVYFGDPDFSATRVAGSVKKFAGSSSDPEIGEKVYEYLRYNNDGPFMSQDDPFLQPGPLSLEPGGGNPVLSRDQDFWGSLTGHKIPTPDDVNIENLWNTYDMKKVIVPYRTASWMEFMPHEVPLKAAVNEVRSLFNKQRYNLNSLPLSNKGLGSYFGYSANSIYKKYQFASHDFSKTDHSKDYLEAVYSTSLLCWLGVLDFEYGLPQRVNNKWNGEWKWGNQENTVLWGPGSNLDWLDSYGINKQERIHSRELYRNKWTQYSTMFVTGKNGSFQPNSYFYFATMPWGCKTYDAGTFGGKNVQMLTGLQGFTELWNHSKTYTAASYPGTQSLGNYGNTTRWYLMAVSWPYEGFMNYSGDKKTAINPFLELIYRQWMASIGAPDEELRDPYSDSYNLPTGNKDSERYTWLIQSYNSLQSAMTTSQKDFVKSYIRRIYPTNPTSYAKPFSPSNWSLVDPAPTKPVILPFGSDTAVAEKPYVLRIIRAQAKDGDIKITASDLPSGAKLVETKGKWAANDYEYSINWTPTKDQAGKSYTINLTGTSSMGTTSVSTTINVVSSESPVVLDDIPSYSVYEGQELAFPLTVQNYNAENLQFSMEGSFGKVINNAWNTAGIYMLKPEKKDVGVHTVTFTVKDKLGNTSTKSAKITVTANSKPEVQLTPTGSGPGKNKNIYRVKAGDTLKLTFDATDADGDKIEISKNPEFPGTINNNVYTYTVEDEMAKNFPGPNVLTFEIKDLASSGSAFSYPKYKGSVTKKVLLVYFEPRDASSNHTPWAVAGSPQTVKSGQKVTLDGTGSDDTDKDQIKYKWSQASGPKVELSDTSIANPTFNAPNVTTPTILKFYLTVTDPGGLSDSGVVRVKVDNGASNPTSSPSPTSTATVSSLTGDINQDNIVNMADVIMMAKEFNGNKPGSPCDINGDSIINMSDIIIVAKNFNKSAIA